MYNAWDVHAERASGGVGIMHVLDISEGGGKWVGTMSKEDVRCMEFEVFTLPGIFHMISIWNGIWNRWIPPFIP